MTKKYFQILMFSREILGKKRKQLQIHLGYRYRMICVKTLLQCASIYNHGEESPEVASWQFTTSSFF